MQVQSGDEALRLFMDSGRTVGDLVRALDYRREQTPLADGAGQAWKLKVVVREFRPIDPAWEFRGFVSNRHLTALSQYFCDASFPYVVENAAEIPRRAARYFSSVLEPMLPVWMISTFAVNCSVHAPS